VPRRRPPPPAQLRLSLEAERNQPPKAPPSTALLEALAELLLTAMSATTVATNGEEAVDERQDRR
jgi:hypothetical protein